MKSLTRVSALLVVAKFTAVLSLVLQIGCINMSTLQTAETLPKGKARVSIGGGYYTSPAVNSALKENDVVENDINVPYLEGGIRYGVSENLDVGGKLTIIGTISADAKYRLLDQEELDLAVGGGIGYFSLETGSGDQTSTFRAFDFMIPFYASYRTAPWFAMYAAPKYVLRYMTSDTSSGSMSLMGSSLGLMFGEDKGAAIEVSYLKDVSSPFNMLQVGGGFFF